MEEQPSYYQRNRERLLAQCKAYADKHRAKYQQYNKEYYQKNKEQLKIKHKNYFLKNKKPRVKKAKVFYAPPPVQPLITATPEPTQAWLQNMVIQSGDIVVRFD